MFTLKQLKMCSIVSARKDIRFYLNSVMINSNSLVSTDGHIMAIFDINSTDLDELIIPNDIVDSFIKEADKATKTIKNLEHICSIVKNENDYTLQLENLECKINFNPIDAKYPDCNRVVPRFYDNINEININSIYLEKLYTIAKIQSKSGFSNINIKFSGKNVLATFNNIDNLKIIIATIS